METPDAIQTPAAEPTPPPARSPEEVRAYHRIQRKLHIADILVSVVYWTVWLALAGPVVAWIDGWTDSRWVGLFATTLISLGGLVLLSLPLTYYGGFVVEQRFQLSNQTPRSWLIFQLKAWLVGAVFAAILVGGLYALLWHGGRYWSIWLWVGVMVLSVVIAKVFPLIILPIFYPARPLERPSLKERLERMASGTGLRLTGVYDLALSKDTKKANAMLAGLGSSRRVYLSDTLLGSFNDDQIAVVFAHELGHHLRGHIWKGIGLSAVVSSILVALIHWRLQPCAGQPSLWPDAVAALPQVLLLATLYPLLVAPVTNAISRRFERQCDSDALRLTEDPQAYRTAFEQLGMLNLSDPNPPRWEVILFDDHPPLAERIAMADRVLTGSA